MYTEPALFNEIITNLFMGGTDDDDVIHQPMRHYGARVDLPFDAIVTMYAWARPADWNIQEFRYAVEDGSITKIDLNRLREAVLFGYNRLQSGDRILVRCQAGLNRSGLVTALIMMMHGYSAIDAIELIREKRHEDALFNESFANWLIAHGAQLIGPAQELSA
jgi:protein-tyrosine phosphatase